MFRRKTGPDEATMARIYDKELAEVNTYMDANGRSAKYLEFQAAVLAKLRELTAQPELKGRVYEIVSRASSEHEPIKSRKKIALKLRKWRKDNRAAKPSDIHDIAGLTISCPYPSDVGAAKDYIQTNKEKFRGHFSIEDCREIDRPDYRAFHLELRGKGQFVSLRCELQIKTVFARGWGVKTHDLIYKPPGDIDARLQMHIDKLGQVVKLVDDQSEIVRSLIETAWSLDKKRRDAAQRSLLSEFSSAIDAKLSELLEHWKKEEPAISAAAVNSDTILSFDDQIDQYADSAPLSLDFCRLVCLYALSRSSRDRNDFALSYVDKWISRLKRDDTVYKRGLVFLCNALMAMGEYEECIQRSKNVIKIARQNPSDQNPILISVLNHAYYLSEAYYHRAFDEPTGGGVRDKEETDKCGVEALRLIERSRPGIEKSKHRNQLLDTVAAVLISCGQSSTQIREGLEIARTTYENAKGKPGHDLIAAFYALHERRAFVRLLKFE
jgi:ppGpp synthetase/RelA/SpoT-type nucleotidyltranferase